MRGRDRELNCAYFDQVARAWRERRLVLFVGTGLSTVYGLPDWSHLVVECMAALTGSTARASQFRAQLAGQREFTPPLLARLIRYELLKRRDLGKRAVAVTPEGRVLDLAGSVDQQRRELVRAILYESRRSPVGIRTAIDAVADLVAASVAPGAKHWMRAVVTTNYDDLIEQAVERRTGRSCVREPASRPSRVVRSVVIPGVNGDALPIRHVNGLLPERPARYGQSQDIILSEDDFHLTFRCAPPERLLRIKLADGTGLFVGMSMQDPGLRYLIDEQRRNRRQCWPRSEQAQHVVAVKTGDDAHLDLLRRRVFKGMGLGVIWIDDYDRIPELLSAIPAGCPPTWLNG